MRRRGRPRHAAGHAEAYSRRGAADLGVADRRGGSLRLGRGTCGNASRCMNAIRPVRRRLRNLLLGLVLLIGLLVTAAFALKPAAIPPSAIASSVIRTPALLERAWRLPAAAAYKHR